MARKTKPLTDTEIKAAKPKDADYQLFNGEPQMADIFYALRKPDAWAGGPRDD